VSADLSSFPRDARRDADSATRSISAPERRAVGRVAAIARVTNSSEAFGIEPIIVSDAVLMTVIESFVGTSALSTEIEIEIEDLAYTASSSLKLYLT
jgi:hypothetical protein